jgi:hypothetical protein
MDIPEIAYISGTIDRETIARGHKNEAYGGANGHYQEPLGSTPSVHHLGHWKEDGSGESIRNSGRKTR